MKQRAMKITAFVIALGLILGIGLFANHLMGNPISKALASRTAQRHLESNYSKQGYLLEKITFKNGYYCAYVSSPYANPDRFLLFLEMDGDLHFDTYEVCKKKGCSIQGLYYEMQYKDAVEAILNSKTFPYDCHFGTGDLGWVSITHQESNPSYAIVIDNSLDSHLYTLTDLEKQTGKLILHLRSEEVSVEQFAKILLDVRHIFEETETPFYWIDCILESSSSTAEERLEIMDFPRADIYEEGLTERVRAANEAIRAYHAAQDAENQE